jgi:hypothetical protein
MPDETSAFEKAPLLFHVEVHVISVILWAKQGLATFRKQNKE